MRNTITSSLSGHTLFVETIADAPAELQNADHYMTYYVVRNWDDKGTVFMYLGKGNPDAPEQIVAWYPNGRMWSSFGTSIQSAIEGAQQDGWMYATPIVLTAPIAIVDGTLAVRYTGRDVINRRQYEVAGVVVTAVNEDTWAYHCARCHVAGQHTMSHDEMSCAHTDAVMNARSEFEDADAKFYGGR